MNLVKLVNIVISLLHTIMLNTYLIKIGHIPVQFTLKTGKKTTLLNAKIKVSKVQNLVPKVPILGFQSVFLHLRLPLFKLVFALFQYDMTLLEPDFALLKYCFYTFNT